MLLREASTKDWDNIWPIFQEIVSKGDTYAYPTNITKSDGRKIWINTPEKTFVVIEDDIVSGTYYLKTNQTGLGSHFCNCGYMVAQYTRGKGVATAKGIPASIIGLC